VAAFNWVVDATGSPQGLREAVRMVKPRGTIILSRRSMAWWAWIPAPVIVNEITLVGSRCGRFEPALDLLRRGLIDVEDMISEREKLANAPARFRAGRAKRNDEGAADMRKLIALLALAPLLLGQEPSVRAFWAWRTSRCS